MYTQNNMQLLMHVTSSSEPSEANRYDREDGNVERYDKEVSTKYIYVDSKFRCFEQNSCFLHQIQM